jgi:hypothetical protein
MRRSDGLAKAVALGFGPTRFRPDGGIVALPLSMAIAIASG